jgi:hypothetical protein
MSLALLSRLGLGGRKGLARTIVPPPYRPAVEGLEDRVVPAASPTASLPLAVHDLHVTGTGADQALEGTLTLAGQTLGTIPVSVATVAPPSGSGVAAAQQECPLLDLHLGPINLNLLGLHVDTSEICLDVTATNHQGLLGGLLCDLSSGLDLGGILGQLDQIGTSVNTLLNDLDRLLTNVLSRPMNVTNVLNQPVGGAAQPTADPATCDILNLSLGPVDLRVPLLGVNVFLNNCADPPGPITVDLTADPNGGLLGSLLCGLADLDLSGLNLNRLVRTVDHLIDQLGGLVNNLDRLTRTVDRIADQLEHLADQLSHRLTHLVDRLERVIDRLETVIDNLPEGSNRLDRLTAQLGNLVDELNTLIGRLT